MWFSIASNLQSSWLGLKSAGIIGLNHHSELDLAISKYPILLYVVLFLSRRTGTPCKWQLARFTT
jgi:hypothetical protein